MDSVKAELFEVVLPQALYFAHDKENVLAIWWYEKSTGRLLSDSNPNHPHSDELHFGDFEEKNNNNWLRGRLIKYEGKVYLVVYLQLGSTYWNVSEEDLNKLAGALMTEHKVNIDFIVDQDGHRLVESQLREETPREFISFPSTIAEFQ